MHRPICPQHWNLLEHSSFSNIFPSLPRLEFFNFASSHFFFVLHSDNQRGPRLNHGELWSVCKNLFFLQLTQIWSCPVVQGCAPRNSHLTHSCDFVCPYLGWLRLRELPSASLFLAVNNCLKPIADTRSLVNLRTWMLFESELNLRERCASIWCWICDSKDLAAAVVERRRD